MGDAPSPDHEHHITSTELAQIRGPYVRRPAGLDSRDWERWANEVMDAHEDARRILGALAAKRGAG